MTNLDLFEIKKSFQRDGTLICFAGPFSHSIIEELGNAVRRYLETEQVGKASMMDVFSIFIEQTQNVRNYAASKASAGDANPEYNQGIVVIGKSDSHYQVSAGNLVESGDISECVALLDRLRSMDKAALKALYKERLHAEPIPGRGPGLGLIDMARKSAIPLEYLLRRVDDRYSFFSVRATV